MSVDPTDCPECSGFHLGWREDPPPCADCGGAECGNCEACHEALSYEV